jgi:hypothetical protein
MRRLHERRVLAGCDADGVTIVRYAAEADLGHLAGIEDAADALFAERFGPGPWGGAPSGPARAAEPGFLLVAAAMLVSGIIWLFGMKHLGLETPALQKQPA